MYLKDILSLLCKHFFVLWLLLLLFDFLVFSSIVVVTAILSFLTLFVVIIISYFILFELSWLSFKYYISFLLSSRYLILLTLSITCIIQSTNLNVIICIISMSKLIIYTPWQTLTALILFFIQLFTTFSLCIFFLLNDTLFLLLLQVHNTLISTIISVHLIRRVILNVSLICYLA